MGLPSSSRWALETFHPTIITCMAHHIYHTRGIVLSSVSTGEANVFYYLLTEDLGLVGATAQGVRHARGKFKTMLQDFAHVGLDLVRGKEVWRITGVFEEERTGRLAARGPQNLILFARIASLVRRLVRGEEQNRELFRCMVGAHEFLTTETLSPVLVPAFEALSALRILALLGYVDTDKYAQYCGAHGSLWDRPTFEQFSPIRRSAILDINAALKVSHL